MARKSISWGRCIFPAVMVIFLGVATLQIWVRLKIEGELINFSNDLGRRIGLGIIAAAEDAKSDRIDAVGFGPSGMASPFHGFSLVLRNHYKLHSSNRTQLIGFYVQSKAAPWWLIGSHSLVAIALFSDSHTEVLPLATADSEIAAWTVGIPSPDA